MSSLRVLELGFVPMATRAASYLARGLASAASLEDLSITRAQLTSAGAIVLSRAICVMPSLKRLNLAVNEIADRGLVAIGQALRHAHQSIKDHSESDLELSFSANNISHRGIEAFSIIANLSFASRLKGIDLSQNRLSPPIRVSHLPVLESVDTAQSLNPDSAAQCTIAEGRVHLDESPLMPLWEMLARATHISFLGFSECELRDADFERMCLSLASPCHHHRHRKISSNMKYEVSSGCNAGHSIGEDGISLSLYGNHLTDMAACCLAGALAQIANARAPMKDVDLGENFIGDRGAEEMACVLRENKMVEHHPTGRLAQDWDGSSPKSCSEESISRGPCAFVHGAIRLHGNRISDIGACALLDALCASHVRHMDLRGNAISATVCDRLSQAVSAQNRALFNRKCVWL
jgi:hypothetical protein